ITISNPDATQPITNINLTDTLPSGLTFKTGSVSINGSPDASADPTTGISIPTIAASSDATVSFVADVTAAPSGGALKYGNTVTAEYTFQSPDSTPITSSVTATNTIYPDSIAITPTITKSDTSSNTVPHVVAIGDTVTYTITISNPDPTEHITNINLTDTLPSGLTFKTGSVSINGSPDASADPTTGISIATIAASSDATVSFVADVTAAPSGGALKYVNTVTAEYSFESPDSTTLTNSVTATNTIYPDSVVITPTITKSDNTSNTIPHIVAIGDTVTYTITISNPDATQPITNINLTDTLPSGLTFKTGSVSINGSPDASADPTTGISIPTIAASSDATVSFVADVTAAPSGGALKYVNTVTTGYTFQSPDSTPITSSVTATNTIYPDSVVITPTITKSDTSSNTVPHVVAIGDTVTYTITISNPDATQPITNINLTDTLPSGLTFKTGSVSINGSPDASADPTTGISIPTIAASSDATVSFVADVTAAPSGGATDYVNTVTAQYSFESPDSTTLTNSVTATNTIYPDSIVITPTITKSDNTSNTVPHIVAIGDTVTYTITISNPDPTEPITNINLTDTLPSGLTFKTGSVSINGSPDASADPTTGISIATIAASRDATVSFVADVTAAPSGGATDYVNTVTAQYSFEAPDSTTLTNSVTATNTLYPDSIVITPTFTKSDTSSNTVPHVVAIGDTVTFSITISNPDATEPITNINLTDTLPAGLTFKTGSVSINGSPDASADPTAGISIPTIAASSDATVSFVADVTAAPSGGALKYVNTVTAEYTFQSPDSTPITSSVTATNTIYPDSNVITPTITKSDTSSNTVPHVVAIGDTVTYTITISNPDTTEPITNIN
ncbi:beta strand repeat-containing protein, partial [Clostridium novyi]|uniref:beta strand repeat-containing protein n=1 Tax=Clostridium novyi TaxID=1542 RepID=UPI0004D86553